MDLERLRARMNLMLVVPLLEDIVAHDPAAAELCRGWNCVIMLHVQGEEDLAMQLKFEDGRATALPGRHHRAIVAMDFKSVENLNATFSGGQPTRPGVSGIWHFIILSRFAKIISMLPRYLKPRNEDAMTPDQRELRARMIMRISVLGLSEIVANHPDAPAAMAAIPEGSVTWKALPSGPAMSVTIKDGGLATQAGALPEPDATVEFKTVQDVLDVMGGKVKAMEALGTGALAIKGMTQIPMMLSPLQQKIGEVLGS